MRKSKKIKYLIHIRGCHDYDVAYNKKQVSIIENDLKKSNATYRIVKIIKEVNL